MSNGFDDFDIHEFLESLRKALSSPDAVAPASLAAMLAIYGEKCEEANRRLRECATLSQKGMYANAVALAEREPNLLDRCSVLEIPERDILGTVATALAIHPPALLNLDLIEILQETYQKGTTTESNLRILHRLTLARAPLPTRLVIMRRLQVQDSNLPFIDTDIRTFERTWFKRAADFAQPFVKAGNVDAIDEIINDLRESGYLETPPQQLMAGLQTLKSKTQALQLPILAEQIKKAFSEQDAATLKPLVAKWMELITATGMTDANSRYQVIEAITWATRKLAEEARDAERKKIKTRLTNLLESPKSKPAAVVAAYNAAHTASAIDMVLQAKYEAWTQRKGSQKTKVLVGAAIAFILLLGAIGYYQTLPGAAPSADVLAFVDRLKQFMKKNDFAAALEAGKDASPQLADNPEVIALLEQAVAGQQKSEDFKFALRELKVATSNEDLESLEKTAREAAHDESQLKQVDEVVANLKGRKSKSEETATLDFESRLADLRKKTNDLLAIAQSGKFGPQQGELSEKYHQEFSKLDAAAREQGRSVPELVSVKAALDTVAPWTQVANDLSQFSAVMSTESATDAALNRAAEFLSSTLAKVHPDTNMKQRAKAARQDLDVWKLTLKLKDRLRNSDVDDKVRQMWSGKPPAAAVEAAMARSKMLSQRKFDQPDSSAAKLKARLLASDIKDVYCVRIDLSEPYCYWYTSKPLKGGSDPVSIPIITEKNQKEPVNQMIRGTRKDAKLSAQSMLLPELEKLWTETVESDQWNQHLADAYEKLASDSEIEPLLKLELMRRLLDLAVSSSIGYRGILEGIPEYRAISGDGGVVSGNWYNPKNILSQEREKATSLCDKAPHLAKFATEATERDNRAMGQTDEGIHLVGFLKQNHGGEVTLAKFSDFTPVSDSNLYVISEEKWVRIGSFPLSETPKLEAAANRFVAWPVFSVSSSGPSF
jgi:hypothetical protein